MGTGSVVLIPLVPVGFDDTGILTLPVNANTNVNPTNSNSNNNHPQLLKIHTMTTTYPSYR